ncbi:MAG: hypothetical protein JSU85_14050 [Candidatus Zixiibacteriota bacterium]|nr:MAG: hypothetical protein JSU85_14050 [candidate division Zixibacteria bacterium]
MTTPLYQTDSYLREFEAKVVEANKDANSIALDKTAFYPGGGGQPTSRRSRRLPLYGQIRWKRVPCGTLIKRMILCEYLHYS